MTPGPGDRESRADPGVLLLFDVDGTLITAAGAGSRAVRRSVLTLFGFVDAFEGVEFAGRTDALIVTDALTRVGVRPSAVALERVRELYLEYLLEELAVSGDRARPLPGVEPLLEILHPDERFGVGLLTGNWREGAMRKLAHCGIAHYFAFGAFAEDGPEREKLVEPAIARGSGHTGLSYAPSSVWVIGDTPHDIRCGKAAGACTLGVTSGPYDAERLRDAGATLVISGFDAPPDRSLPEILMEATPGLTGIPGERT